MHRLSRASRLVLIPFSTVLCLCVAWPARTAESFINAGVAKSRAASPGALRNPMLQVDPCLTFITINFGQEINGKLEGTDCKVSDGSFVDFYAFNGFAGQQIAISLDATAFDAYLVLLDSNGNLLREDDDGGGGSNSRIPPGSAFFGSVTQQLMHSRL